MKDIYLDMNSQNILKFYGTRLDAKLDSSEFYDYEITKVANDYNTDVLDLYTPIVYESLKIDQNLTNLQCQKSLINLTEDNISDLINGYTYSGLVMTLNYNDFTNHFGVNYKNILLDSNRYKFTLINGETHYFKIGSYNLAYPDSNALTGYTKSQLISGFTTDVYKSRKNIINPNACSPLAPIQVVKPWAYDFSEGQGADNCTPTLARRTEKGWTLDFIFNRNNLSWASGGIFYYWGVRGTNDVTDYADNNLSFGFTSDGRIKWSAYRYSGACVNGEYSESYYLSSGQTPTLCTTGTTKDFNITITFDRYKHYDGCDIENDGGWNDMIGFRTSPYQNIEVTAVTSTQLSVWDPAESLSQKWADERQRRLGTLKIYVNGRPIYKLENWEEIIPSTRGVQPFIQSWGAGTGLMGNIHNGICCFKMKTVKYYEEPLDFVHVRHNFLTRIDDYDFYICGLGCVDDLRGLPIATSTPTPTHTHTSTPLPSATPVPTQSNTPTPTPTPTPTEVPIDLNLEIEVSPGSIIVDFTVTSSRPINREITIPVISYLNLLTSEILTVEADVVILSGQTSGTTRVEFAERSFSELDLSGNINVGQILLDGYEYEVFAQLVFNSPTPIPTATSVITPTPNPTATLTSTPIPTATETNLPTATPVVYYYYYLRDCNQTHNKIGRSLTSGLGGITYSVGNSVCYEIVGIDLGPTFDYDLDTLTVVSNCNDVVCLTPTQTPTSTATATPSPTPTLFIPENDFAYVIIPGNNLVYIIVPNNDLTYRLIPSNDLTSVSLPNNDLEYLVLPLNDVNYTLIPNTDLTYTLIPNNDIEYNVLKQGNSFYGQIILGEDDIEGTCNCAECPRFYVTGDGPTFCESNIFVITGGGTFFSGWGTIVHNGYYKTVNMDGSNVATYRTDCGTCPTTPTPTETPTPTPTPTETPTPTPTPTETPITSSPYSYTIQARAIDGSNNKYGWVIQQDACEGGEFNVTIYSNSSTFVDGMNFYSDINASGINDIVTYMEYYYYYPLENKTFRLLSGNVAGEIASCPTPTPTATSTPTPTMLPYNKIVDLNINSLASYSGSGTTVTDILGNTNAYLSNLPVYQNNGCGSSIALNGNDQYIITTTSIQSFYDSTDTSLFLWVYLTDNGVILSEQGGGGLNFNWHDSQIELVNGTLKFTVWPYNGIITSSISTPLNNWYYIGFVYNNTTLTAYVNGQSAGSSTVVRQVPYENGHGLYYAIGATDSTNLGDGTYSALKFGRLEIWDGAISSSDVLQNYNDSVTTWICPTPTPTPTPTETPTSTPTSTPTPTPTQSPLDFSISGSCINGGSVHTYNHIGGSGTYDRGTGLYDTELEALNETGWIQISNPSSFVSSGVPYFNTTRTYWVALRDRNNQSNIVVKSILVDCEPTPTPTPTSTSTPTPTATSTPTPTSTSTPTPTPTPTSGLIVTISEVGSDVIMSGSGSLNLTGLIEGSVQSGWGINGTLGTWVIGPSSSFFGRKYQGNAFSIYPTSFGSGYTAPTSFTGDAFGIQNGSLGKDIIVPIGYTSGSPLSGTATFANKTISGMGLTPGTYLYSWGTDSITLQIGT